MSTLPPRPALAALAAYLDDLRDGATVTSVHESAIRLSPATMMAAGVPEVLARATIRSDPRHFSAQWTDMRMLRRVPPLGGMVLPSVVVLSHADNRASNIATATTLWRAAKAEEPPRVPSTAAARPVAPERPARPARPAVPTQSGRPVPPALPPPPVPLEPTAAAVAVSEAHQPGSRPGGRWAVPGVVTGVGVIVGGGFIVNAGLDRTGVAGYALAGAGALVAAVGADMIKRYTRRLRHRARTPGSGR